MYRVLLVMSFLIGVGLCLGIYFDPDLRDSLAVLTSLAIFMLVFLFCLVRQAAGILRQTLEQAQNPEESSPHHAGLHRRKATPRSRRAEAGTGTR